MELTWVLHEKKYKWLARCSTSLAVREDKFYAIFNKGSVHLRESLESTFHADWGTILGASPQNEQHVTNTTMTWYKQQHADEDLHQSNGSHGKGESRLDKCYTREPVSNGYCEKERSLKFINCCWPECTPHRGKSHLQVHCIWNVTGQQAFQRAWGHWRSSAQGCK